MIINNDSAKGQCPLHIAVIPPNWTDPERTRAVASIIKKDLYGTRLLLAGKIPRILATYPTFDIAQVTAQSLLNLGLIVQICRDLDLRRQSMLLARSLIFSDGEIEFVGGKGRSEKLLMNDVLLLVTGEVEIRGDKEVTKISTKLNLPATLLTGGIPIHRKVSDKVFQTITHTERFVLLYNKANPHSSVELRQNNFDYSCLGSEGATSSLLNFNKIVTMLARAYLNAAFDDSLNRVVKSDVPTRNSWDAAHLVGNLICIFASPLD
jgi:hypothetical protein